MDVAISLQSLKSKARFETLSHSLAERLIAKPDFTGLDKEEQSVVSALCAFIDPALYKFTNLFTESLKALLWAQYSYGCGYVEAVRHECGLVPQTSSADELAKVELFLAERKRFDNKVHPLALWGFAQRFGHYNASEVGNSSWAKVASDVANLKTTWSKCEKEDAQILFRYAAEVNRVSSAGKAFSLKSEHSFKASVLDDVPLLADRLFSPRGSCGLVTSIAKVLLETGDVQLLVVSEKENLRLLFESNSLPPSESARQWTLQLASEMVHYWGGTFEIESPAPAYRIEIHLPYPKASG